ncbi:MAG: hypothetical protein HWE30_13220 [Methylocystaceae bacterium]|nr:hypothetical protein [Methylocystaceae bacterium]
MKTGVSVLAVAATVFAWATVSNAADVINEDEVAHVVLVNGEQEVTVEAGSNVLEICAQCSIQLQDSADAALNVAEDTTVIISDGKLSVE